jgi:hypothetical protein
MKMELLTGNTQWKMPKTIPHGKRQCKVRHSWLLEGHRERERNVRGHGILGSYRSQYLDEHLTWDMVFHCKRFPDVTIRKLKARFCVRGDRQSEGIGFFDMYAPVLNWLTVRLMLVLLKILGLATKQVDYTAALVSCSD